MYKLLVLCGALFILIPFLLQYTVEQNNHRHMVAFQNIVDQATEEASASGCFTPQIIADMKADIIDKFDGVDDSEIVVDVTDTPRYKRNWFDRNDLITYEIGIPIKQIIAANQFWGISDEDNSTIYYIKGAVRSEVLSP